MRILGEFDYRNAKGILESRRSAILQEIYRLLNAEEFRLRLGPGSGKLQNLSRQLQRYFADNGWAMEPPMFTLPDLRYDLLKEDVPIEVEIGHERLVYAVFFKFLADYSQHRIPAGVMVVTMNPRDFGHSWHNSLESTKRKVNAIASALLVPILVLGIQP
ncbi:MAG TPA: BglII/BstYI family type II restriction endonuclease [Candidatus Bathyarchaeia archaeon]